MFAKNNSFWMVDETPNELDFLEKVFLLFDFLNRNSLAPIVFIV